MRSISFLVFFLPPGANVLDMSTRGVKAEPLRFVGVKLHTASV